MEIKNKEFFTEIKYQIEKLQIGYSKEEATQKIAEYMCGMIQDYEDVNNDKKRLVREIDVILCGKDAAIQASLCDLVNPIRELKEKHDQLVKNQKAYLEAIRVNNLALKEIYEFFGNSFNDETKKDTEMIIEVNEKILN